MRKSHKNIYHGYCYAAPKTGWSSDEGVKNRLTRVDLTDPAGIPFGGLPVISDGKTAYIDSSDAHTLIAAISGMKKSICVFMPLIYILSKATKAPENFVVTDPKGELYSRTSDFVRSNGYRVICLDFRSFCQDGFNLLEYPAKLYRSGDKDKAVALVNNLVYAVSESQRQGSGDPFWVDSACSLMNGTAPLMFESFDLNDINFSNWDQFNQNQHVDALKGLCKTIRTAETAMTNLQGVVGTQAEKTLQSSQTSAHAMLTPFLQNNALTRMISHSTFDLNILCEEKVGIYIITDDTTKTFNAVVGAIVNQMQNYLVDRAFRETNGSLNIRVNFLFEEFLQYFIPNMDNALSAHRSRNIRYYLCVQSIAGLKKQYKDYQSLLANCGNVLYLGSTEAEMREYISDLLGTTEITPDGRERPLVSMSELASLEKSWDSKEAIFISLSDSLRYSTRLPSIEVYGTGSSRAAYKTIDHPPIELFTPSDLVKGINRGLIPLPFSNHKKASSKNAESVDLQSELELKFDELFGSVHD